MPGLVRFGNATKATQFRSRMDNVISTLAQRSRRQLVAALPPSVRELQRRHNDQLLLCSSSMDGDDRALVLQMLNDDWQEPIERSGYLTHLCAPGCCSSENVFKTKMKRCLNILFSSLFSPPLLYRWKGFDEAAEFVTRGLMIKGLLRHIWKQCQQESSDFISELLEAQAMDEDCPEANPSVRQQIRMRKVMQLLAEPDALATWTQCAAFEVKSPDGEIYLRGCWTLMCCVT